VDDPVRTTSGAVAGAVVLSLVGGCAQPKDKDSGAPFFEVEYRQISKLPTCLGNRRIKVDREARVYTATNATECPPGERWSTPYPDSPTRTLSPAERKDLLNLIRESNFLDLAPRYGNDRDDGYQEEIDVDLAGKRHSVIVEQIDQPAFAKVRKALTSAAN
jgi:hypothetical protein